MRITPQARKLLTLAAAVVIVFGVSSAVLLQLIPGPLRATDYLVIGTASTLAALLAAFLVVIGGTRNLLEIFVRKRRPEGE